MINALHFQSVHTGERNGPPRRIIPIAHAPPRLFESPKFQIIELQKRPVIYDQSGHFHNGENIPYPKWILDDRNKGFIFVNASDKHMIEEHVADYAINQAPKMLDKILTCPARHPAFEDFVGRDGMKERERNVIECGDQVQFHGPMVGAPVDRAKD